MSSLHKTSTAACILLLIVDLAFASVERTSITDQTLISFASGADVVDACIQKINQNGLFTYDEKLLERIAITESGYTYKNKKDGGIWQLTLEHFKETKDHISPYLEESIRTNVWLRMEVHEMGEFDYSVFICPCCKIIHQSKSSPASSVFKCTESSSLLGKQLHKAVTRCKQIY